MLSVIKYFDFCGRWWVVGEQLVFDVRVNKCERARHRLQRGVIKLPVRVLIVLFMEASLFSVNAPFQCFFFRVSSFQSYTFIYLLIYFILFSFSSFIVCWKRVQIILYIQLCWHIFNNRQLFALFSTPNQFPTYIKNL